MNGVEQTPREAGLEVSGGEAQQQIKNKMNTVNSSNDESSSSSSSSGQSGGDIDDEPDGPDEREQFVTLALGDKQVTRVREDSVATVADGEE